MKPGEVPAGLVTLACEQAYGTPRDGSDDRRLIARALAAVLPEHEKQVREKVADEIKRHADEWDDGSSWGGGMLRAEQIARGEGS